MKSTLRFLLLFVAFATFSFGQTNYVTAGQKLTLVASADGTPPLNFTWKKNGVDLATGTTFTVEAATTNDSGEYTVEARNEWGSAVSQPFIVSVGIPPSVPIIKMSFGNVTVRKQRDVTLAVIAEGDNMKFKWQHGTTTIPGADGPAIFLRRVNQGDAGVYACTVSTAAGTAIASGRLTVLNN